jgi:hypothetical protein
MDQEVLLLDAPEYICVHVGKQQSIILGNVAFQPSISAPSSLRSQLIIIFIITLIVLYSPKWKTVASH